MENEAKWEEGGKEEEEEEVELEAEEETGSVQTACFVHVEDLRSLGWS